ncbi:MAG: FlgD immunoglobulin-like domain containing protein, partial [bacterium]
LIGTVHDMPELIAASLRDRLNHPIGRSAEPEGAGENLPAESAPALLSLSARPNPFSGSTTLRLTLPSASAVKLSIYDVNGRLVETLAEGRLSAGEHRFEWDGRTASGTVVAPGSYIAVMDGGGKRLTQKLFILP